LKSQLTAHTPGLFRKKRCLIGVLCYLSVAFAPAKIKKENVVLKCSLATPVFCVFLFCLASAGVRVEARTHQSPAALHGQLSTRPVQTVEELCNVFLGIPYRADGVINDDGHYATFKSPDKPLPTPGLNCSGFVLVVSRLILNKSISLSQAVRDRENDSGPGSPFGHDWDFGFDLIMNCSDGARRTVLFPKGDTTPEKLTGFTAPAWDPHADSFATDFLPHVREGHVYLVSFSRHRTSAGLARSHYHVGLFLRAKERVWFYSTTHESGRVIRMDLASAAGLAQFRWSFRNTKNSFKRLTIVETQSVLP